MKKDLYIVVAESAFAKIFTKEPRKNELTLVHAIENPEGRKQRHELDADKPGMNQNSTAGYHSMGGEENSHDHDVENYARDVCQLLQQDHNAGKFSDLQIAAGPHLLGLMRKHLSGDCEKALTKTVNKNLIHADTQEILAHFA
ncbi:MAG: host attachment protein [Pseudomonadota bacterium]